MSFGAPVGQWREPGLFSIRGDDRRGWTRPGWGGARQEGAGRRPSGWGLWKSEEGGGEAR